jgi:tRNA(fMet)-specific endonuclease VapC
MRYLLDTNICIVIIRKKSPLAFQKVTQQTITDVVLSTLTVAELQYGVHKSADPLKNQQALDQFLVPFTLLDFDFQAAQEYGKIRAYLEKQGISIGSIDTLLAAQALAYSLIMVTNNVKEFSRVPGLQIEDWTKP